MDIFVLAFNSISELTKKLYFHLDQGLHWCGNDIVDICDGSDNDEDCDDDGDSNRDDDDDADDNFGDKEGGMCFTIHYINVDIFKFILGSKATENETKETS